MNLQLLKPIESKRQDPVTGVEYTFRAAPPVDFTSLNLMPGTDAKDFVLIFFWQVMAGGWDIEKFPNFYQQTADVLPILKEVVAAINVHYNETDPAQKSEDRFKYYYSLAYGIDAKGSPSDETSIPPSNELLTSLASEVSNSPATEMAMAWYIDFNKDQLDAKALAEKNGQSEEAKQEQPTKKPRLFANSREINQDAEMGVVKTIGDGWAKMAKAVTPDLIKEQFKASRNRSVSFKAQGRVDQGSAEMRLDKEVLGVQTAEQCVKQLMKMKDPKVIQSFFSLWKFATVQDSYVFKDVPISKIMALVLKTTGENKFNTLARREFSEILKWIDSMTIAVTQIKEEVNPKTGKKKPVLTVERGIKVFHMKATYSIKKQYQSLPKDELTDEHFDQSVINHFSGELLPGSSDLFAGRANVYSDNLLSMSAKHDGKAILLGLDFQSRFAQMTDKTMPIERLRSDLINYLDYQKMNQSQASKATKLLATNLDKLIKAGIISSYSGLTHNDMDKVHICPPIIKKSKTLS